jgi:hypothetical protein
MSAGVFIWPERGRSSVPARHGLLAGVRDRLSVTVSHNEMSRVFLGGPRRRKAIYYENESGRRSAAKRSGSKLLTKDEARRRIEVDVHFGRR